MILIVTQCFPPVRGGIENLMGGLADALAEAGQKVTVLADAYRGGEAAPVKPYPVQWFSGARPWRRFKKMRAAQRVAAHAPLKAVVADSWKSVETLPAMGVPLLVLAHGMEFPATAKEKKRARIRAALAKADWVIANSEYTAALARPYLASPEKLLIIHPPIAPQPQPSAEGKTQAEAWLKGGIPMIFTLARLEPRKGVDMIIRAMPAVRRAFPQARYVVAGAGDDLPRLQALAQECDVADAVTFVGKVDGDVKAALYARADVFAMPARREGNSVEGFGITYMEAAWYGCPSIAGRDGGAVDAVLDGVTGLTCDGAVAADVEAKLLALLRDEPLRQQLGGAAKARVHDTGLWTHAVARYLALMQR